MHVSAKTVSEMLLAAIILLSKPGRLSNDALSDLDPRQNEKAPPPNQG